MTKQYRVAFDLLAKPFRVAAISGDTLLQDRDAVGQGRGARGHGSSLAKLAAATGPRPGDRPTR